MIQVIIPVGLAVAAGTVWYFTRKSPEDRILEDAPSLKRPSNSKLGSGLRWNEGNARKAACAGIAAGYTDESVLTEAVAKALYPRHNWPPTSDSPTRAHNIWPKILQTVRDALAGGCDG